MSIVSARFGVERGHGRPAFIAEATSTE